VLREAFEYLFDKGNDAADMIVTVAPEPAHVYYIRRPDGSLEQRVAAPPLRQHTAYSLTTVAAIAAVEAGEVWYGLAGVVLRHGTDLRDKTTLPVLLSDALRQLVAWREGKAALPQADLIRILRTTFFDSLSLAPTLIDVLRKIRFNSGTVVNAEVGHGKASIGKELMGEVTGTGAIPEYVRFNLPVFANACFRPIRANVECALEPDASRGEFRVIPLPGEIEDAIDAGTTAVGESLRESLPKDYPLYHGSP
jgi:hypothetical protein